MFRKRIRMVLRRRKIQFWQQCRKNFAESPKNFGPYSGTDKKKILQVFQSLQKDHLYKQNTVLTIWQTYHRFSENSGKLRLQSQKIPRIFFFFHKLIPSEWPSVHVEVRSDNRADFLYPLRVRFLMPKVQKS